MKVLHKILTFIALALMLSLISCGSKSEIEPPEPPAPPVPNEKAHRTVLVYMVATNNLGTGVQSFAQNDLDEMVAAAAAGGVGEGRLLVYHVAYSGIVLKEITKNGVDTLKVYDNSEPSVPISRMRAVVADAKTLAPADEYGIVLWSHATGWLVDGIAESGSGAAYSFGSDRAKKMNISSLSSALSDAGMAFVYFDCCLMNTVEVVYQMRDVTPVIIGSDLEVPTDGMPYHLNVPLFFADGDIDYHALAKSTFDYYDTYRHWDECVNPPLTREEDRTCAMSVIRTADIAELAAVTREIYSTATFPAPSSYVPQQFFENGTGLSYYYDWADYVRNIATDADALSRWEQLLARVVTYSESTPRLWDVVDLNVNCGLSTYIFHDEKSALTKGYDRTSWYEDVASVLLNK